MRSRHELHDRDGQPASYDKARRQILQRIAYAGPDAWRIEQHHCQRLRERLPGNHVRPAMYVPDSYRAPNPEAAVEIMPPTRGRCWSVAPARPHWRHTFL